MLPASKPSGPCGSDSARRRSPAFHRSPAASRNAIEHLQQCHVLILIVVPDGVAEVPVESMPGETAFVHLDVPALTGPQDDNIALLHPLVREPVGMPDFIGKPAAGRKCLVGHHIIAEIA